MKIQQPKTTSFHQIRQIKAFCDENEANGGKKYEYCKDAEAFVFGKSGIADLAAQQTMATATRGILFGTWFQILIGSVALAFLMLTVWQAKEAAAAASGALEAANRTAESAENAERAQMAAIFSTEFSVTGVEKANVAIVFNNKNIGKTPAYVESFKINWEKVECENCQINLAVNPERMEVKDYSLVGSNSTLEPPQYIDIHLRQVKIVSTKNLQSTPNAELKIPDKLCHAVCEWVYKDINNVRYMVKTQTTFRLNTEQRLRAWEYNEPKYVTVLNMDRPVAQQTKILSMNAVRIKGTLFEES